MPKVRIELPCESLPGPIVVELSAEQSGNEYPAARAITMLAEAVAAAKELRLPGVIDLRDSKEAR